MYTWNNELNLTSEEVRKAIAESGLCDYGVYKAPLSEKIAAAERPGVVCALDNADTRGALLALLKDDPEKILKGISYAAIAAEADEAALYVPDYADDVAEAAAELCAKYNIALERGIVDVRKTEGCLYMHIAAAADLADLLAGELKPGYYVSVDGAAPVKADADAKLSDLLDLSGAQAIIAGYEMLAPADGEKTLGEVAPEDGYLRAVGASECIVVNTGNLLTDSRKQSCGKCVFCREGLIQLQYMTKEFTTGRGKAEYIDLTKEIGEGMLTQTPCSMGQKCAVIALDAAEKFESVYKAHIKKNCSVCFSKEVIYIDPKLCQGCEECADVCPHDCIEGKAKFIHMIDDFDCDLCGKCIEACDYDAVIRTTGKVPKLPNRLTKVGKFKR